MVAAAAIGSAVIGAAGSAYSASQQSGGSDKAAANTMKMYQQTRSDLLPFMQGGQSALSSLQGLLGLNGAGGPNGSTSMLANLQNYPGYQFAFNQGLQGLDRSAASRGLLLSGAQVKDAQTYGQGQADQLFGTYAGQLSGLAGLGENAAAKTGDIGGSAAQVAGNYTQNAGTAASSGVTGATNQISNLLNSANFQSLFTQGGGSDVGAFNTGIGAALSAGG